MANNSTSQYGRKLKLIVADDTGNGLDLSSLKVTFKVKKTDTGTPNSAIIRAYNLAEDTVRRIREEFSSMVIEAGYDSNFGLIFTGDIKQVRYGRENATDTYIDIAAGDADEAHNFAVVNKTLSPGATQIDQINAAVEPMEQYGISLGFVDNLDNISLPRGKVMHGMCKDYLDQVANTTQSTWSIQNKKVQFVKKTTTLPSSVINLNSKTGLIGVPEQTNDGISIRVLLNPLIKVAGKVKIDNASVADAALPGTNPNDQVNSIASKSADGVYRVLVAEYFGGNFENDWYTDLTCLAVDETAPPGDEVAKS